MSRLHHPSHPSHSRSIVASGRADAAGDKGALLIIALIAVPTAAVAALVALFG